MDLTWWIDRDPLRVYDLDSTQQFARLCSHYAGAVPDVFLAVLGQARGNGARWVAAEHRYIDADYRSEHSLLYSKTFRRYPSITHRLHFFCVGESEPEFRSRLWGSATEIDDYLGYTVVRPVAAAPVGRTVIAPPAPLRSFVSCVGRDPINLYGRELRAFGAPFMSQDGQVGTCAHATVWEACYFHTLAYSHPRFVPADIAALTPGGVGRNLPSSGASVQQLTGVLTEVGLPALVYHAARLPVDDVSTLVRTYLDSALPVIATGRSHAFVLIGYRNGRRRDGSKVTQFIRHDDQAAPYSLVEDPGLDPYRPWEYVVIPLPKKLYISGEKAVEIAETKLRFALAASGNRSSTALLEKIERREVCFRAAAMPSNRFKARAREKRRGGAPTLGELYGFMQLPKWVWVVEAVDEAAADAGKACVEAEALIDATDHTSDPHVLSWRLPHALFRSVPDMTDVGRVTLDATPKFPRVTSADGTRIDL